MNSLDLAIMVLCGLMVAWGAMAGIIAIALKLAAAVIAVLVGSRLGPKVGEMLVPASDLYNVQTFVGFMFVFFAIFIAFAVGVSLIGRVLNAVPFFGWFNSLGGAVVGLFLGVLLSFSVVAGLKQLEYEAIDETITDSTFGSFIIDNFGIAAQAAKLIPQDWEVE